MPWTSAPQIPEVARMAALAAINSLLRAPVVVGLERTATWRRMDASGLLLVFQLLKDPFSNFAVPADGAPQTPTVAWDREKGSRPHCDKHIYIYAKLYMYNVNPGLINP